MISIKTKYLLLITFFFYKVLYAQLTIPKADRIVETFHYDIALNKAVSEIKTDIKNNKDNFIFHGFTLTEASNKTVSLIGRFDAPFIHLIELANPISQIALDELKENIASILCKVTLNSLEENKISVSSEILSYKIKEDVNFDELHKQGIRMYAKNVKLDQSIYTKIIKRYLLKKQSDFDIDLMKFSREKGFDNISYKFDHFIPKTDINITTTLNKKVPKQQQNDSILLIYKNLYSDNIKQEPSLLYGLDLNNPKFLWTYITPNNPSHLNYPFNVHKGTIYLTSEHTVQAVNPANKNVYWSAKFPDDTPRFDLDPNNTEKSNLAKNILYNQKAHVSGEYVFVNDSHYIYCLDRYTGKLQWAQNYGDFGISKFHFDHSYLYKSRALEMFKIHKQSGEVAQILHNTNKSPLYEDQFFENQILVFGDLRKNFAGFDTKTDKVLWNQKIWDNIYKDTDTLETDPKSVFWKIEKSDAVCFNAATGEPLHVIVLNEDRDIINLHQNKDYIIVYFSSEGDKDITEDHLYLINKKERAITKKWFISPQDRSISNFDDSLKNKITYLSDEKINIIDLEKLTIKTYQNKIIKPDLSLPHIMKNYHIDWVLPE
ncbi:MAG: hypothetical protein OIF50_07445 [Flavobacteriaceae bacterium]|nr:hypothetical protein [Flavobacteriaceae bacterium]